MFKHAGFSVKGKPLGIFLYTRKFLALNRHAKVLPNGGPDTDCNWDNKRNGKETERNGKQRRQGRQRKQAERGKRKQTVGEIDVF
jgi:hypothetical protein